MKIKLFTVALAIVFGLHAGLAAQVTGPPEEVQRNVVLIATVGPDFRPFETRLMPAGKWSITPIRDEAFPESRFAWATWTTLSPDWGTRDCDQSKRGWNTDFFVSVTELPSGKKKKTQQFTSSRCRTPALAVANAQMKTLVLQSASLVTFFLSSQFYDRRGILGGGVILRLEKQPPQQQR